MILKKNQEVIIFIRVLRMKYLIIVKRFIKVQSNHC